MSATQLSLGAFERDALPAHVNGWTLADEQDGFRYHATDPLSNRVYWEATGPNGLTVTVMAHTGTRRVSVWDETQSVNEHIHTEKHDRSANVIGQAVDLMEATPPEEVREL